MLVGENKTATSTDDITVTAVRAESASTWSPTAPRWCSTAWPRWPDRSCSREFERLGDETVDGITREVARL